MQISSEFMGDFLRNDFIIVRLLHLTNPSKNLRIAELRLMRKPSLNILALKKIVIQRISMLMFKHNIGIVPHIASIFTTKSEIHGYNTRHCRSLHPEIGKSEATYYRTFS